MTTAATSMIDTLFPAASPAATGLSTADQSLYAAPFASLLAEGHFVQAPGVTPSDSDGVPSLAALLSLGGIVPAVGAEDVPVDPAFNVIPLFDSTSLSTPITTKEIPGLGLDVTGLLQGGAQTVAPVVNSTAKSNTSAPTASPLPVPTGVVAAWPGAVSTNRNDSRLEYSVSRYIDLPAVPQSGLPFGAPTIDPVSEKQVHKAVTAADVMAEIAQYDSEVTDDPKIASHGKLISSPVVTPTVALAISQQAADAVDTVSVSTLQPIAALVPVTTTDKGELVREGVPPDPRTISGIVQAGVPRPQSRSTGDNATPKPAPGLSTALSGDDAFAAVVNDSSKLPNGQSALLRNDLLRNDLVRIAVPTEQPMPATGLSSGLNGDVAFAAMATEAPKAAVFNPVSGSSSTVAQGAGAATASLDGAVNTMQSSSNQSSFQQSQSGTGQGKDLPSTFGQVLNQASGGVDNRTPIADISDLPTTTRGSIESRIESRVDTVQPPPQSLRVGDAAIQPNRPAALPAQPSVPPAEQVAMQLRHAVAKGADKITIQLNPISLGSIDVTLEVSQGARVTIHVVAERADTLDLLRADSRGLERALQDAGLRTDSGSLNFNLRGEGGSAQHQNSASTDGFDENGANDHLEADSDNESTLTDATPEDPTRQASDLTLDIEV